MSKIKNLLFIFIGEILLFIRWQLFTSGVFSQLDYGTIFLMYILYLVCVVIYFFICELKTNNNHTIKMSKYAIKYGIVFIIAIIFDMFINMDNAINQLVYFIEDLLFFGLDFIFLLFLLKFKIIRENKK